MAIEYTIKSGDTLTKIARKHYGLQGKEAYKKALDIAKANNIANPDLIYAGATLKLCDTKEEKQNGQKEDIFNKAEVTGEKEFINTYQELLTKQKAFYQFARIDAQNKEYLDKGNEIENVEYNSLTDRNVIFADMKIFSSNDVQKKVELYRDAALQLAQQDIEANDKEDENGTKDGMKSFDEFKEEQLRFYDDTYRDLTINIARNRFIKDFKELNNRIPIEIEIQEGIEEDTGYQMFEAELKSYDGILRNVFNSYDVDKNGFLDKTEVAATYIAMDATTDFKGENSLKVIGEDNETKFAFDGTIDIESIQEFDEDSFKAMHHMFFGTPQVA